MPFTKVCTCIGPGLANEQTQAWEHSASPMVSLLMVTWKGNARLNVMVSSLGAHMPALGNMPGPAHDGCSQISLAT